MNKIDIVVTWVDGTDPEWLEEKRKYSPGTSYQGADTENRYRPSELFRYWFRGVEKFAPWVNKVFFVTYGHVPSWLDVNHPKLKVIKHTDYIPTEYLPTYNSNVIELNLHRIDELSEQFILFNDDTFIMKEVRDSDFFENGKIKDLLVYRSILPDGDFSTIEFNNVKIINKHFEKSMLKKNIWKFLKLNYGKDNIHNLIALLYPKINGYKNSHLPRPHLKSTFKEVWKKENELLLNMCFNKFRKGNDINHYLMTSWNIESDRAVAQNPNIGRNLNVSSTEITKKTISENAYKLICINDDLEDGVDTSYEILKPVFEKILGEKSSYEIN